MNTVCIAGRIGRINIKEVGGKALAELSIALRAGKDKTDWVEVKAWEKTAELLENYTSKGSMIGITGQLRVDNYTDKNDNKVSRTYVNANQITLLDSKKADDDQPAKARSKKQSYDFNSDDEIPF